MADPVTPEPPSSFPMAARQPREKFIDNAWKYDNAWSLFSRAGTVFAGLFNRFEHSIRVVVQGGPEADARRVWYLACSAAFGRYRNRVKDSLAQTAFQGVWNVSAKSCAIEILYTTNAINQAAARKFAAVADAAPQGTAMVAGVAFPLIVGGIKADPTGSVYELLSRGPEQLTVGADWPTWLRFGGARILRPKVAWTGPGCTPAPAPEGAALGYGVRNAILGRTFGLQGVFREWPIVLGVAPADSVAYPSRVAATVNPIGGIIVGFPVNAPIEPAVNKTITLPDDGRVITTADKSDPLVQPPVPPIDGNSRYNASVGLFAQLLHCPCFLPTTPACTPRLRSNAPGVYVYTPGSGPPQEYAGLNTIIRASGSQGVDPEYDTGALIAPNVTEAFGVCFPAPAAAPAQETKMGTALTGGSGGTAELGTGP